MLKSTSLFYISLVFILSWGPMFKTSTDKSVSERVAIEPAYEISLAQWSLHRAFFGPQKEGYWEWFDKMLQESPDSLLRGKLEPKDFPTIASGYGIKSIELVNLFYYGKVEDAQYWSDFKQKCKIASVTVGLIMCDRLGNLADANSVVRMKAIQNHYKWIDVSLFLGAHSIRVNAAGQGSRDEVARNAVDGLSKLGEYAASKGINVIVENHGGYSSDGAWLAGVMEEVGMDNVGTLPDFGNFCVERNAEGCVMEYDRYKGMAELMPFAKGVSAKSHEFDENGNETVSDFYRIMKIVKSSGYEGYIGIEYEGSILSEEEGIKATKALLEKAIQRL